MTIYGHNARSLLAMHKAKTMLARRPCTQQELVDTKEALRLADERIAQLQQQLREATRAEERQAMLQSAHNDAAHGAQITYEFLATLSHELRTPLSAMLGWAQVLRSGTRNHADLQRGLEAIERNARAQAQVIDDLLDISNISAGKVLLDMQAIAPARLIEAAIAAARPTADAKHITITMTCDPATGDIAGDPDGLRQVIWNLLSNALKFTPRHGAVHIAVQAFASHVEITINDNGVGIRPDFLAHVFERFRQADSSTSRQHGGLGLGLAIVKHLVDLHGGTVRACSAGVNCGASFTLQLPLASMATLARPGSV